MTRTRENVNNVYMRLLVITAKGADQVTLGHRQMKCVEVNNNRFSDNILVISRNSD